MTVRAWVLPILYAALAAALVTGFMAALLPRTTAPLHDGTHQLAADTVVVTQHSKLIEIEDTRGRQ